MTCFMAVVGVITFLFSMPKRGFQIAFKRLISCVIVGIIIDLVITAIGLALIYVTTH